MAPGGSSAEWLCSGKCQRVEMVTTAAGATGCTQPVSDTRQPVPSSGVAAGTQILASSARVEYNPWHLADPQQNGYVLENACALSWSRRRSIGRETMSNTISSRTPEVSPNTCPICHNRICIEPSQPSGDAPCPNCGALLWFIGTKNDIRCYDSERIAPIRNKLVQAACEILRIDREQVSDSTSFAEYIGADSLDIVELVMKVEEGFGVSMPDGELERIRTLRDAIEYLARHAF